MNKPIRTCVPFEFGSATYRESVALRDGVLRKPLGLNWAPHDFDGEEKSFHLGCFEDGTLVASLILKPLDATTVKMRQVAVASHLQSSGIGSQLVRFAEEFAAARGITLIVANARESAMQFYRRLGYEVGAETFFEVGIPHRLIKKRLPAG